jgi:two-component system cell cycle response regulator DivK
MTSADERVTTILVVEDDPWIRSLLTDLLSAEGYDVEVTSNGISALRLAREHHPDVVLLDLAMPEMSGLDVLRELRQERTTASVPIIG